MHRKINESFPYVINIFYHYNWEHSCYKTWDRKKDIKVSRSTNSLSQHFTVYVLYNYSFHCIAGIYFLLDFLAFPLLTIYYYWCKCVTIAFWWLATFPITRTFSFCTLDALMSFFLFYQWHILPYFFGSLYWIGFSIIFLNV